MCVRFGNLGALERAKNNLDENYSVVGILEDIELSLKVLELKLPKFFSGVSELFQSEFIQIGQ